MDISGDEICLFSVVIHTIQQKHPRRNRYEKETGVRRKAKDGSRKVRKEREGKENGKKVKSAFVASYGYTVMSAARVRGKTSIP